MGEAQTYGTYVIALALVTGVSRDQIMIKSLWEGEAPIRVEDEGIAVAGPVDQVSPGDFVRVKIRVYEPRIPRTASDLEPPMGRAGETYMELVELRKLSPEEVLRELVRISRMVRRTHYSISVGRGEVREVEIDEGGDDWTWVRGRDDS